MGKRQHAGAWKGQAVPVVAYLLASFELCLVLLVVWQWWVSWSQDIKCTSSGFIVRNEAHLIEKYDSTMSVVLSCAGSNPRCANYFTFFFLPFFAVIMSCLITKNCKLRGWWEFMTLYVNAAVWTVHAP